MTVTGTSIKQYLDDKGIKYSFLSEKADMPMNVLSPLLNDKRKIEVNEYLSICQALGVPLEKFLTE